MATIEQMNTALSRYYNALNHPYDNQFLKYCDENGIDEGDDGLFNDEIDCLFNPANEDIPESLLVEFDDDFPVSTRSSNKSKFICSILKKCYNNPNCTFISDRIIPKCYVTHILFTK